MKERILKYFDLIVAFVLGIAGAIYYFNRKGTIAKQEYEESKKKYDREEAQRQERLNDLQDQLETLERETRDQNLSPVEKVELWKERIKNKK